MTEVQRRAMNVPRNEENLARKALKNYSSRPPTGRAALTNISNIQRNNTNIPTKKKDTSEKITRKPLHKSSSQTNLQPTKIQQQAPKEKFEIFFEEDAFKKDLSDIADDFLEVEDIDEDDLGNPTLCAEYVKDIYKYLKKLEIKLQPDDYMLHQPEINKRMRNILVDWLIQVQSRFNLLQETLYLTVYLIDRFLSKHDVARGELQLVGVTAMLLASKYEEMYAPEIGDFVYITDNAYSKAKIRAMELKMLKACDFDLSNPLCLHFLRRNSKAGSVDAQKHTLAKFLMELTLVEYNMVVKRLPSEIAAASLYLSILLIDESGWTPTLEHYSGYSESYLLPIVSDLAKLVFSLETSKQQAVKTKYAASKFLKISRLPELKGPIIKRLAESHTS